MSKNYCNKCSSYSCGCEDQKNYEHPRVTDSTDRLSEILGKNDNCQDRSLLPSPGIVVSNETEFFTTDGSENQGEISINPEQISGADALLVLDKGVIKKLIKGVEGDFLQFKSGKWVPVNLTIAQTSFRQDQIGEFNSGVLAILGCGPNGTYKLGRFGGCEDALLYFDVNGNARCIDFPELVGKLATAMCENLALYSSGCIGGVIVCTPDGMKVLQPSNDKILVGDGSGASGCWVLEDKAGSSDGGNIIKIPYSGSDFEVKTPEGYNRITFIGWGGAGERDGLTGQVGQGIAGVGGFVKAKFPTSTGALYRVMVGQGFPKIGAPGANIYGFGGKRSADGHNHAGGGLTGLFTGNTAVASTDIGRALAIAAGGGPSGAVSVGSGVVNGWPGNHPDGGGQSSMKGIDAINGQNAGSRGGGGGGYTGGGHKGLAGYGGAGYVSPTKIAGSDSLLYGTPNTDTAPGNTDEYYVAGVGTNNNHGYAVVVFTNE